MSPIQLVLSALSERGIEPGQSGSSWSCRCPAHEDDNPSLNITTGDNECVLIKCFAGCTAGAEECVQFFVTSCQQFHAAAKRCDRQFARSPVHSLALIQTVTVTI